MQQDLDQARDFARTMSNQELVEETSRSRDAAVIDVRFSYGEVPGPGKRLLMVAGVGTAVQLTRLPGAPIRDVAGDALPTARRSPADLATRAAYHHAPRFPGITDSTHR